MSTPVKLFQFLQKSYEAIGFYPSPAGQNCCLLNSKNLFIFLSIFQLFLSSLAFFYFEAASTFEYGASFYASITELFSVTILLINLSKMANILTLIHNLEEFIASSKFEPELVFGRFFYFDQFLQLYRGTPSQCIGHVQRPECANRAHIQVCLCACSEHRLSRIDAFRRDADSC